LYSVHPSGSQVREEKPPTRKEENSFGGEKVRIGLEVFATSPPPVGSSHVNSSPYQTLTTFESDNPVYLNVSSADGTKNRKATLSCQILAGTWAKVPHCNSNTQPANIHRNSWTLYTDYHIFSRCYWDMKSGKICCKNCGELSGFQWTKCEENNCFDWKV
jgi:hypothetical protein